MADIVAVVKHNGPRLPKSQHCLDVYCHRLFCQPDVLLRSSVLSFCSFEGHPLGDIAVSGSWADV